MKNKSASKATYFWYHVSEGEGALFNIITLVIFICIGTRCVQFVFKDNKILYLFNYLKKKAHFQSNWSRSLAPVEDDQSPFIGLSFVVVSSLVLSVAHWKGPLDSQVLLILHFSEF